MAMVNVRELSRNTSKVVGAVARTKRPTLIVRGGKPIAALYAVEAEDWEDWVLANAPEFIAGMRAADEDMRHGRTITLDEYFAARKSGKRTAGSARKRTAR